MLYIHIPFCDSKCYYCNFNSYTQKGHLKNRYLKALLKDLKISLENTNKLDSIYIGGGTPSVIKDFSEIFEFLQDFTTNNTEITIEANPNSATKKWLKDVSKFANRLSLGVQSFDNNKLKFLNRNHLRDDAIKAIYNATNYFNEINIDLIYNTKLDSDNKILNNDLNIIKKLPINHISLYSLTIEEGIILNENDKIESNIEKELFNNLLEIGFFQYEISNFTKKNISKHNLGYWEYKEYIGTGAGGVGREKNIRYYKENNIEKYIQDPTKKEIEYLSSKDIKLEKIFLGLRSIVGVDIDIFNNKELEKIDILIKENKLVKKNNKIFNKDFLLTDEIVWFIL